MSSTKKQDATPPASNAYLVQETTDSLARLTEYRQAVEGIKRLIEEIAATEDAALMRFYDARQGTALLAENLDYWQQQDQRLMQWLCVLLNLKHPKPHRVTLALFSENAAWLRRMARAYFAALTSLDVKIMSASFNVKKRKADGSRATGKTDKRADTTNETPLVLFERIVTQEQIEDSEKLFVPASAQSVGVAFDIASTGAYTLFEPERGLHTLIEDKQTQHLYVHTSDTAFAAYRPPPGLEKRGALASGVFPGERRRTYHPLEEIIKDARLNKSFAWRDTGDGDESLAALLRQMCGEYLSVRAIELIDR